MPEPLIRPFLKWAGGKRQLLPAIRAHLPEDLAHRRYFEPFVGAGAVLLDLAPDQAVVNDFNSQLILTYSVVRDQVEELLPLLAEYQARHCEAYYYSVRAQDRLPDFALRPPVERAARLIYLNRTCYNGLYRVNSKGQFNVPFGRYTSPKVCESELLRAVSRYLAGRHVTFRSGDFEAALAGAAGDCFVYLDPPYHGPDSHSFTTYQAGGFDEGDQTRLRDAFARLTTLGARCLLSNADTPFIRALYGGYPMETVPARRLINSRAAARGAVDEILIWNW